MKKKKPKTELRGIPPFKGRMSQPSPHKKERKIGEDFSDSVSEEKRVFQEGSGQLCHICWVLRWDLIIGFGNIEVICNPWKNSQMALRGVGREETEAWLNWI